jgi:hypothetical protein
MKTAKLLKKFEAKMDGLFDALFSIRDIVDDVEDEQVDYLIGGFIDQIELAIGDGNITPDDIKEQINLAQEQE